MLVTDYQYLSSLVEQVKIGDSNAFSELYTATYQKQYRFAIGYLRDEYLAQDAIQELYILVLKNMQKLKDPNLFISWINQINFRVCFDMAEKRRRALGELEEDENLERYAHPTSEHGPEFEVLREDERVYLLQRIKSLPLLESKAIAMRYYRNMKLEDIATAMECSRSSVKRYIASGLQKLKATV